MLEAGASHHIQVVKVCLVPNVSQASLLLNYTTGLNAVYNTLLYKSREAWTARQEAIAAGVPEADLPDLLPVGSAYALEKYVTAHKHEWFPWADQVPAAVFSDAAHRLADAYTRAFKKQARLPRMRRRRTLADAGAQTVSFRKKASEPWLTADGRHITLPVAAARRAELGLRGNDALWIRVGKDKAVARAAKLIKSGRAQVQEVTFSYSGGYWWASIRLRVDDRNRTQHHLNPAVFQGGTVGIDLGMGDKALILSRPVPGLTDADGVIAAPHHLKAQIGRLGEVARQLEHTTRGSRHHAQLLARYRKLHHVVSAERRRWHHQVANWLCAVFDTIVVEDLSIKSMARRKKGRLFSYGRAVADLAPASLYDILDYKTLRHGRTLARADRWFPSSKTCSNTGVRGSESQTAPMGSGVRLRRVRAARRP